MGTEFAHPDLFGAGVLHIKILRAAFPAGRVSQPLPAAGLVSGALIEMRVHEGFDQRQRMPPVCLPIFGEPREHEFHEAADEVGALSAGENQEAGVVDQQRQARAALLRGPADEGIARLEMPGRAAPGGQRQPPILIRDDVAQVFAHDLRVFQIVMFDDELVEAGGFLRRHQADLEVDEDVLFIVRGRTKAGGGRFHWPQRKKSPPGCPAKSFNQFPFNHFHQSKTAS